MKPPPTKQPEWAYQVDRQALRDFLLSPEGQLLRSFLKSRRQVLAVRCETLDIDRDRSTIAKAQGGIVEIDAILDPDLLTAIRDYFEDENTVLT